MMLTEDEINTTFISQAKIFHFGTLSMTQDSVRAATKKAVKAAKESGALISFDPNLREPLWSSLELAKEQMNYGFSQCDILKSLIMRFSLLLEKKIMMRESDAFRKISDTTHSLNNGKRRKPRLL